MTVTLHIERLVHGGLGIARREGAVVFVSDVIAGEVVEARITGRRARCDFAEPVRIIDPSPYRRPPFCPHAALCGGCDWQHITAQGQLAQKQAILAECLRRQAGLSEIPAIELFASPETAYRIRAQFQRAQGCFGFFRRKSNDVVAIGSCPLLALPLNTLLARLCEETPRMPPHIKKVMAIAGDEDRVASTPVLPSCSHAQTVISVGTRRFTLHGHSFFQNNFFLHETLGSWAAAALSGRHCLDLYGGAGFFSVMLAHRFESVTLVEQSAQLTRLAGRNFTDNQLSNCRAICADAESFNADSSRPVDSVLLDPPRQGLSTTALERVAALVPGHILYVSCDPATLSRDIGRLRARHGYELEKLALFDLYPNTHHLETQALLRLKR